MKLKKLQFLQCKLNLEQIPHDYKGISENLAVKRLQECGKNIIKQAKKTTAVKMFANQYKDILTIILLISTLVSIFMGEIVDAIVIAIIVLMNGIMGFVQEYKTEKTLDSLKKLSAPTAKVYRDNALKIVPADEIVFGDLVLLEEGDQICADGFILECLQLKTNESILTGEVNSIDKTTLLSKNTKNELNRKDMVYMGTNVSSGHGKMVVGFTGMNTQMGQIASMIENIDTEETPLQKKLAQLGKYIAVICLVICASVSIIGFARGENILDMLLTGISLAVAAIPEGLPAIVTIALALAVSRLIKQNALVRKLPSVETLGCVNIICSDKTGTLTENKMRVTSIYCNNKDTKIPLRCKPKSTEHKLLLCGALCNTVNYNPQEKALIGEPTEVSLVRLLGETNVDYKQIQNEFTIIKEQPFTSANRYMWVISEHSSGEKTMFMKGSYDVILSKCSSIEINGKIERLTKSQQKLIASQNDQMASNGLRVLGFAYKATSSTNINENDLVFLGLIGMLDPPRKEVPYSISSCKSAGIKPIMITGDHMLTATAIGKMIGLYNDNDLCLTGEQMKQLTDKELKQVIDKVSIFARVSPKDKLRIVSTYQEKGNIVAMTGDGVNDAPAIKKADIGVSMGINGTDVTKQASDIILLDDNFASLVNTINEGRCVYSNIRRFIRYLLSCNIGEVLCMLLGMILGMPVILLPIQILLINLVTDGLPAIALGIEPKEKELLLQKPRKKSDSIFAHGLFEKIVFRGILIGICTVGSFLVLYNNSGNIDLARTGAYATLIITQLFNVFECKSEYKTIFHINFFNNIPLLIAVFISIVILLLTIYITPLQFLLNTVSLSYKDLLSISIFLVLPTAVSTIRRSKLFNRKKK